MDWSIVLSNFPLPHDLSKKVDSIRNVKEKMGVKLVDIKKKQGSVRSQPIFNKVDEDIDLNQDTAI